MIAWNSNVLTTAARLYPYLDRSYVTATTEATLLQCTTTIVATALYGQ